MTAHAEKPLSKRELKALNEYLAPLGKRICTKHQGHPLPLDVEHFYVLKCGGYLKECKDCVIARTVARSKARYHDDPAYVQYKADQHKKHYFAHLEACRAGNARRSREYRKNLKRKRMAQILAVQP